MIKVTLESGAFHLLESIEALEEYSSSVNTRAAIQAAYDAGNWEPYEPPEPEPESPQPDWDSFNAAIMVNPRLNAVIGATLQQAPAIAMGVPSALAQVSTQGVGAFRLVFDALCQLGGATADDRNAWAAMAEDYHLPADFVATVKG